MPKLFYPNQVRVLSAPLSNGYARVECLRFSSAVEDLWLCITWHSSGTVTMMRTFQNAKEFEQWFNKINKKFRDEKRNQDPCPYAGFKQGEQVPF